MIKLIIFDLDGTLLDTSRDIQNVTNASLKKFGLKEISYEQTLAYVGDGARKLIERAVGSDGNALNDDVYTDYFYNFVRCDNLCTTLYDGEDEVLTRLSKRGVKFAVITNKPQEAADRVCAQYLEKFGFGRIIGGRDGEPRKPDPSSTSRLIAEYGLEKDEVLFVGDGETDVRTAVNAGIKSVSVLWGFRSRKQLEEAGATRFAENYRELENIVLKF